MLDYTALPLTVSTNIKTKMCYFTSNRLLFDSNFFPILISGGSAITLFKLSHNCTTEVGLVAPPEVFFLNRGIDKYKGIENDEKGGLFAKYFSFYAGLKY